MNLKPDCQIKIPLYKQKAYRYSLPIFVPRRILGLKKGYVRFTFGRGETGMIEEGTSFENANELS